MSHLQTGPSMHQLHQRLLAYPGSAPPRGLDLLALVHDLAYRLDPETAATALAPLADLPNCQAGAIADANTLRAQPQQSPTSRPDIFMLILWLLADDSFTVPILNATDLVSLLLSADGLMVNAQPDMQDEDQREELIRLALNSLRLKPKNETDHQARDRLLMISSSERARVVAASRAAEERADVIRKALAEKRAREAADKYTRE